MTDGRDRRIAKEKKKNVPVIGLGQDENPAQLVERTRYPGQTEQKIDYLLIGAEIANFVQRVVVSHASRSY